MTEAATAVETTEAPAAPVECMIHVRFYPDGTAAEITERPSNATAHQWFKFLCRHTLDKYAALSGGRGLFRMTPAELETIKAAYVSEQ